MCFHRRRIGQTKMMIHFDLWRKVPWLIEMSIKSPQESTSIAIYQRTCVSVAIRTFVFIIFFLDEKIDDSQISWYSPTKRFGLIFLRINYSVRAVEPDVVFSASFRCFCNFTSQRTGKCSIKFL